MQIKQQSGNVLLNILLIIMFIIIAVLIYILAGGKMPKFQRSAGVQSPNMELADKQNSVQQMIKNPAEFSDGLTNPDFSQQYQLDEFGAGVAERDIFDIDINNDGRRDRITRTRNENGTSHFFYQYKIELNQNGQFVDITPDGFRTTEGAECALQKLQFVFQPEFKVIKISRDWDTSWDTPTMAYRTVYTINNNELSAHEKTKLKTVCDVTDLF